MANVFTRKHHRPRTTTLRDFCGNSLTNEAPAPRRPRIMSPTRRCNPHPTGLVTQQAYNKDSLAFDIWKPDFTKIAKRMPRMISHLQFVNFVSGKVLPPLESKEPFKDIKYTTNTTSRRAFQKPEYPEGVHHSIKASRFEHTPYNTAQGIVPATLPAIYCKEHEKSTSYHKRP